MESFARKVGAVRRDTGNLQERCTVRKFVSEEGLER